MFTEYEQYEDASVKDYHEAPTPNVEMTLDKYDRSKEFIAHQHQIKGNLTHYTL